MGLRDDTTLEPSPVFLYERICRSGDDPAPDDRIIDVGILDMNYNWPNLGHDSIVHSIGEMVSDLASFLETSGMAVRVLSYDVRGSLAIPEYAGDRLRLFVGTGGPGHIDPHYNDGVSEGSQGVREDPSWEAPLFDLFEKIRRDEGSALLAVCHTFGVMCRWSGVAQPVLRGPDKGGKSTGVLDNVLTPEAIDHPWFSRLSARLPDHRHLSVLDSRLYDLIPSAKGLPPDMIPIGYEASCPGGPQGEALTMLELARDRDGIIPRIFAVNHHPEIVDRLMQYKLLELKYSRRDVRKEWYEERVRLLDEMGADAETERMVRLTSRHTFLAPLRFHLYRQIRSRALGLGHTPDFHENQVLEM
jgi:hypothetical protein